MTLTPEEKKIKRSDCLFAWFIEKRGSAPSDKYEKFLLKYIIDIGELYDETTDAMRKEIKNSNSGKWKPKTDSFKELQRREKVLNTISSTMRRALGL